MMALQSQLDRLDAILNRRLAAEEDADRLAAAKRADTVRARQRANVEERREIQARYADAFNAFNAEPPLPADDEAPTAFRKRLFNRLARRLPSSHELASVRGDDVAFSETGFNHFESEMIKAACAEGQKPSFENLPSNGELLQRIRSDDMGEKSINWYGRESFIKSMGREGHRVLRFVNPKTGDVLWGPAFPKAR
jgi:hypothetical protein